MADFLVLGTDTDAGKTTFALLWLSAFVDQYAYWKPVETGDSDTASIRQLVPCALVFPAHTYLSDAVAPPLAARRAGTTIPAAATLAAAKPRSERSLLIESF